MEPESYAKAVSAEVRAAIARAGLTNSRVAELTGISPATLSRKSTGKSPFNIIELALIAQALDLDPHELYPRQQSAAIGVPLEVAS